MKGKRRFIKETQDWIFVSNAVKNGDKEALKIFERYQEIIAEENILSKTFKSRDKNGLINYKECITNLDRIIALKKEKQALLYSINIPFKKAKIYLETLKRKKREEKTLS